jgi:hypothetical protein
MKNETESFGISFGFWSAIPGIDPIASLILHWHRPAIPGVWYRVRTSYVTTGPHETVRAGQYRCDREYVFTLNHQEIEISRNVGRPSRRNQSRHMQSQLPKRQIFHDLISPTESGLETKKHKTIYMCNEKF